MSTRSRLRVRPRPRTDRPDRRARGPRPRPATGAHGRGRSARRRSVVRPAGPAGRGRALAGSPQDGHGTRAPLGERTAALFGAGGPSSGDASAEETTAGEESAPARFVAPNEDAPAAAGLDPPRRDARAAAARAEPEVLSRADAVATARDAVRRSRARLAAEREAGRAAGAADGRRPGRGAHPVARTGRHPGQQGGRSDEGPPQPPPPAARARERARLALRERLPLWVQLRCGVEPRTLLALGLVLLVAVGFGVHHFLTGRPETVRAPRADSAPAATDGRRAAGGEGRPGEGPGRLPPGERVVVDVAGKVRRPGIYRLPRGARVADALKSAGGLRPGTDVSGLNRARRLVDGEQIVAGGAPAAGGTGAGARGGAASGGGAAGGGASGSPVSLSSATAEQLETLPGVGPVLAQHILDYRDQHGGFTSVDQLQDVNGIGERRFADIKPRVGP